MIVDIFMNVDHISVHDESFYKFSFEDVNKFAIAFASKFPEIQNFCRDMKLCKPEYLLTEDRVVLKYNIDKAQDVRLEITADKFNIISCVLVKDKMATMGNYIMLLEGTNMWQKLMKKTFVTRYEKSLQAYNDKLCNLKDL